MQVSHSFPKTSDIKSNTRLIVGQVTQGTRYLAMGFTAAVGIDSNIKICASLCPD